MTTALARWRRLTATERSPASDLGLAMVMAAVAGAANAGGFFAIGQYTSHMSGYLSQFADETVMTNLRIMATCLLAFVAFVSGAGFGGLLLTWADACAGARRNAVPFAVQALFLACFAGGGLFETEAGRIFSLWCLCFIMGMQNATVSIITGGFRTTHVTATVTDLGIDCGTVALALLRRATRGTPVSLPPRLGRMVRILASFLGGAMVGAFGYGHAGFGFSLPLACVPLALALPRLIDASRD